MFWPELIVTIVTLLAVAAEWRHARRVKRIARLAFGPGARPAVWIGAAPILRVAGISLACWGLLSLWLVVEARVHDMGQIAESDYRHLVLVVDVSPSMHLTDAGTDGGQSRRERVSEIVESLFRRIPMRRFKVSLIAVYSDAKPLLEDSLDHEVVRHILERMPMWHAFKSGKTNLMHGIEMAATMAKPWNPGSASVLLLSDGDTVPSTGMPRMPASVAEVVVVGVGDPHVGQFIHDHQSRQDVNALRQIATRLGGTYHNGNQKHLTSQIVGRISAPGRDQPTGKWTRREWSLAAILAGSTVLATVPILLHYLGSSFRGGTPFLQPEPEAV